jgi:hypothetical protein
MPTSQGAIRLALRYPRVFGLLTLVIGVFMAVSQIRGLMKTAPFTGGTVVVGRVVSLEHLGDYRTGVAWKDATGRERTATIVVSQADFEAYKPGNTIVLKIAKDDPDSVMLRDEYEQANTWKLGFALFTSCFVLVGGFFLATGDRYFGRDD